MGSPGASIGPTINVFLRGVCRLLKEPLQQQNPPPLEDGIKKDDKDDDEDNHGGSDDAKYDYPKMTRILAARVLALSTRRNDTKNRAAFILKIRY